MAETYANHEKDVTSSEQVMYSNTSGGTGVLVGLRVTNVNGSTADQVTVKITDSSDVKKAHIAYTMDVPADTSLELLGTSKVFLENGDKVTIQGVQASGYLESILSVLEITT